MKTVAIMDSVFATAGLVVTIAFTVDGQWDAVLIVGGFHLWWLSNAVSDWRLYARLQRERARLEAMKWGMWR